MTSFESLLDRLAPPGMLDARDREFLENSLPVLGVIGPATAIALALQFREVRGALRTDSKLVRFLLLADLLADAGIVGYAVGKARQLKKTETEEQRLARLGEVRPITWKTYVTPLRSAVAVALATSTHRSRGAAIRSGLLTYAFSVALGQAARALKPRLIRASELAAEFRAERAAREEAALRSEVQVGVYADGTPVAVREAIERLERLAAAGHSGGKSAISVEEMERILAESGGGKIVEVSAKEPWTGMTTASRDEVKAALTRKDAEKDAEKRDARRKAGIDDIVE